MNCSWNQYEKLPAQDILPECGADLHLGSYFTAIQGTQGVSAAWELWEQGVQQEQGSWHGRACSCCPEVLLKTVQDCWSQHNDGSDIQQHSLLTEGQSPLVHQRSNDQVSNSDESADVPVL